MAKVSAAYPRLVNRYERERISSRYDDTMWYSGFRSAGSIGSRGGSLRKTIGTASSRPGRPTREKKTPPARSPPQQGDDQMGEPPPRRNREEENRHHPAALPHRKVFRQEGG